MCGRSRISRILSTTWAALMLGCQAPPEPTQEIDDGESSEVDEQPLVKPPPPKVAPAGSLGGICGKDLAICNQNGRAFEIFNTIKFSNMKTKVSRSGGTTSLTLTVEVPRLVNDHKGSKDLLQLRHRTLPNVEFVREIWRNGTRVGDFVPGWHRSVSRAPHVVSSNHADCKRPRGQRLTGMLRDHLQLLRLVQRGEDRPHGWNWFHWRGGRQGNQSDRGRRVSRGGSRPSQRRPRAHPGLQQQV